MLQGWERTAVGGYVMRRAQHYNAVAFDARQNYTLHLLGHTVAMMFVALGILDVLSTNWALSVGAYEINAFMRGIQDGWGALWYVPKLCLQAMVAAMIVWSPNRATILIMAIMCGWTSSIVTNNFLIAMGVF